MLAVTAVGRPSSCRCSPPGLAGRKFGLILGLLSGMTLVGPRFDLGARLGELAQPFFPPLKFFRDRKTIGNIGLIGRFGLRHQIGHLGLQLRFDVTGMLIGQRTSCFTSRWRRMRRVRRLPSDPDPCSGR